MSESDHQKYMLTCQRFAGECRVLAADTPSTDLREHFLRMAGMWDELADTRAGSTPLRSD